MTVDIHSEVFAFLTENRDAGYQAFQAKLIPSISPESIMGVRTPALRSFAKRLAKRPEVGTFLDALPHALFEENQLHGFILGSIKDYDEYMEALDQFLPYVDNWATCDQLPLRKLADQPERTLRAVRRWLADERPYIVRFGIGVLLQLFLDERFEAELMHWVTSVESDEYYVNMMRAWYVAEALAKQPQDALKLLEAQELDPWTHNKAIQKARESRRVPDSMKEHLSTLKRQAGH